MDENQEKKESNRYFDIVYGYNDGSKPTTIYDVPDKMALTFFKALEHGKTDFYRVYEKHELIKEWKGT